jgi:hypothetical protein
MIVSCDIDFLLKKKKKKKEKEKRKARYQTL